MILGNLIAVPGQKEVVALEFFKGVQSGVLFALENPEPDNPFTPDKESDLVTLIDELVEMSADFNKKAFIDKTKELMALSETI